MGALPTVGRLDELILAVEGRLSGNRRNDLEVDRCIPDATSYLVVLFDGLGSHQLTHEAGSDLAAAHVGDLQAPFPTTTTVSLSTIATGRTPGAHGVIGHLMWLPEHGRVVNTLKWVDLTGAAIDHETSRMLPFPNVWERLTAAGVEPVTVQPGNYTDSPLSRMLYRGCRFEGVWDIDELVAASLDLAAKPRRLVFTYLPHVDVAAHVHGQRSAEYAAAIALANRVWSALAAGLPDGVRLLGTADHGHVDYDAGEKLIVREPYLDELTLFGDARSIFATGPAETIDRLARRTGATVVVRSELVRLLETPDSPHPNLDERLPDAAVLAPPGMVILPRGFDKRLTGYHGGLSPAERAIPLLRAGR